MAQRLPVIKLQPQTVMQWWADAGASDEVLAEAYPKARSLRVEPTAMLRDRDQQSLQRPWWSMQRWTAPETQVLLASEVQPGSCQLLWANMMLHGTAWPEAVMQQWQRALSVDGFLMFSCLGPDTLKELRELYRRLGWPTPTQAFVDMHDIGDMLVHAGFADPVMDQERITLTWADPGALLAELRTLGGNTSFQRETGLRTPRWHVRLLDELKSLARADGRLALTFELVYGHAFKAAPRPKIAGETSVSLDDMRAMMQSPRRR
jgi:malonyl-CoA O-methyltransferase